MIEVEKIESLLKGAEKKVHAGEWIRVEVARQLMVQFGAWLVWNMNKGDEEE